MLLTITDIADHFGVSIRQAWRIVRQPGFPARLRLSTGWFGSRRVRLQDGSVVPLNMRLKDAPKLGVHQADLGDDVVSNRELHVLGAR